MTTETQFISASLSPSAGSSNRCVWLGLGFFFFWFGFLLTYSWFAMLISDVQQSDSVIHTHTHTHTYIFFLSSFPLCFIIG